jgi:formate-dependent nitrite reductase cytochrome c552 subunit
MKNGVTSCTDCHGTENWKAALFDHKKSAFPLDGKHINVPCAKCHKPQQEGSVTYTRYKIKDFRCESCHL